MKASFITNCLLRTLEEKMEELNTNSRMCVYFEMLERKFFPDGRLHLVNSNTNSPEELSQAKNAACTAIFKFIPGMYSEYSDLYLRPRVYQICS